MMKRHLARRIALSVLVLVTLSCHHDDATGPGSGTGKLRVLFIGNSLTYTNSLPEMVDALAAASGLSIESDEQVFPGYALIDHWSDGVARDRVRTGRYDVVILQQGPSSLEVNRDSLRLWTVMWAQEIRSAGGRPALYAVWPEKARMYAFADVSTSYHLAATDVDGLFFPVGDTWLETWEQDPNAVLYGPDDFHPSVAGTYAAAVVIVSVLTHRGATTLATNFTLPPTVAEELDFALAATIRRAAQTVISRSQLPNTQQ
jgi:hypothetical protein